VEKPSLRTDQIADLAFYIANKRCLNLSDAGTGKTPSVVVMQYYLWSELQVGTVWVQPKRLLDKNRREILRFTDFKEEDVVIVDGTPKQIEKMLKSGAKVFLMGFRRFALSWRGLPKYVKAVHVDEFHMGFKSAESAATQQLFAAMDSRMEWFLPMTGTIISGKLTSAYPAIHVVEPRYYPSAEAFEYQHAIKDYDGKTIGWTGHGKLSAIFGRHAIRRTFESIHGKQEVVEIPEVVSMTARQREMYDEFHKEAVLELEKFFLDGSQPGVAFIRARQLMEHPNEFPDLTDIGHFVDVMPGEKPGKEELLEIHLEDHMNNGKPLIIFTPMIPQQQRIMAMLERRGIKFGLINGSVSTKVSDQADRDFCEGRIQVLLCSPQCASVGYNWQFNGEQEVDHIIFMTMDYNHDTYLQARQRAIRGKRTTPLRVSVFEYEDSADQHILGIVYRKSLDAHKVDPTMPIVQLSGYQKDYNLIDY